MASRAITARHQIQKLLQAVPFQPFIITMENGDQLEIEHPENIAFDPEANGADPRAYRFYVISSGIDYWSTFAAITGVALVKRKKAK